MQDDRAKTLDLIVEYIERDPAELVNVASHFGLTYGTALGHLDTLEAQRRVQKLRRGEQLLWQIPGTTREPARPPTPWHLKERL
jgi:predicted ArsR family transcriptional regulator